MSLKDRYEFEYYPAEDNKYANQITLDMEMPQDLHCAAFHRMCKKFAIVVGYSPETVEKYFGKDSNDDEPSL